MTQQLQAQGSELTLLAPLYERFEVDAPFEVDDTPLEPFDLFSVPAVEEASLPALLLPLLLPLVTGTTRALRSLRYSSYLSDALLRRSTRERTSSKSKQQPRTTRSSSRRTGFR